MSGHLLRFSQAIRRKTWRARPAGAPAAHPDPLAAQLSAYAADRYSFVATTHDGEELPADAQVVFYGSPGQHVLF